MMPDPPPSHAFEPRPDDVQPGPSGSGGPDPASGPVGLARDPRRVAWMVALVADFIQWVALPLFIGGAASPWNNALDVFVAVLMIRLLGWHWSFLPTFLVELFPVFDLAPTWTVAVWLATRKREALPRRGR